MQALSFFACAFFATPRAGCGREKVRTRGKDSKAKSAARFFGGKGKDGQDGKGKGKAGKSCKDSGYERVFGVPWIVW